MARRADSIVAGLAPKTRVRLRLRDATTLRSRVRSVDSAPTALRLMSHPDALAPHAIDSLWVSKGTYAKRAAATGAVILGVTSATFVGILGCGEGCDHRTVGSTIGHVALGGAYGAGLGALYGVLGGRFFRRWTLGFGRRPGT